MSRNEWVARIAAWRQTLGETYIRAGDASGEGVSCVCLWMREPSGLKRCLEIYFGVPHVEVFIHPVDPF